MTINTVPTTPGLRFSFDGHLLTTNAKGRASFTAQHDFASHTLVALDTTVKTSDRQLAFARWSGQRDPDQAFDTTVTGLPLRANYAITAAFAVRQFVTPIFREVNGKPLDLSRVSSVTLKSDSSQVIAITPGMPLWLDSQRPVYQHSRLSIQPAVYSLQTVMVGGTNVVDVGRQTFKPATQASPTFITQFYDLTVTGYDALFHSPSGDSVVITFPDGSEHSYKLGAGHKVTVTDLPRGTYTVVLKAGRAIVSKDEFVLSKNKLDKIAVISSTDVAILALGVLLLALALLAAGRRAWANRLVRRFRKSIGQGPPMAAPFDEVLR